MMKLLRTLVILALFAVIVISCGKNKGGNSGSLGTNGSMEISFKNMVGSNDLILGSQYYTNANGDTFYVNTYNYYISNIELIKTNDSVVKEVESYHLIKADDTSSFNFTLNSIPVANYKAIKFTIGVDSLRNVSGAQTGALDPVNNMFWSWSTGYIFSKFEGTSPQSPTGNVAFHIAGFSGANNSLRNVSLNFPLNATVTKNIIPSIVIKSDIAEWFMNPNLTKFSITYNVTSVGAIASGMADNYMDMFSVIQVDN
jgi:hypothetical protein